MEKIYLYHTNDLHSHLENWPRIKQFLQKQQKLHQESGEDSFLFDIGDFIDRWHPYTEATMGKGNIALLNECCYTAATIGNNEGVNLPHDDLDKLYKHADFDVLVANFFNKDGSYPDWVKPYKIYQTPTGTKVGVLGLTAMFAQLYDQLDWELTEPIEELKKWVKQLKQESDLVILLSHLGLRDDERIASEFPEIDVILGAHTHHVLETGEMVGDTLIGAAGKYGYYVGQVILEINDQRTISSKSALLFNVNDLPPVKNEEREIQLFFDKGKDLLSQTITTLQRPLAAEPFKKTDLGLLLCRAVKEWCQADCAMINAGLLLGPLAGDVTKYDLLTICPHPINPCVVEITGEELIAVIEESLDETLHHRHIKGLGFRGDKLGIFIYDGVEFVEGRVLIGGMEPAPEKTYTLALPDMFTFGHFFKRVIPQKAKNYFLPEFMRDLLKWKLQSMS
ncbi:bifunctional UDP-sugar hydrolase/5'-nucleotidase [Neobacillus niacini]|uniref:bifunctional metallophosphatase/5'-nucleotidase n=1 Tax=Neobacillus niacini TaxID=86668 RepID=UPI0021CB0772|nr:bifunctional UDP-sugar hydrolase/5'-nucleotidase [Neobacillus niacini]MCM3765869.1 bifunctional metallophosphatase/5'-nucleotidase [Neobacillus niacini]